MAMRNGKKQGAAAKAPKSSPDAFRKKSKTPKAFKKSQNALEGASSKPEKYPNVWRRTDSSNACASKSVADESFPKFASGTARQKARLIVRNVSFHMSADQLAQHINDFAKVNVKEGDVNMLTKKNGLRVGCAFVQCPNLSEAAKVLKSVNATEAMGRTVVVDWAVPKDKFQTSFPKKQEESGDEGVEQQEREKEGGEEDEEEEEDDEGEEEDGDDEGEEEDDDDGEEADDDDGETESVPGDSRPRPASGHDLHEQCTVFLRNLSFDTSEEGLRAHMEENFGALYFAKLVVDKETDRPRGTAFVKFRESANAQKCIEMGEIELDGRRVFVSAALSKKDAAQADAKKKEKEKKDSRNLHLSVEGLVREGTLAAEGVSAADMAKRASLTKWKKSKLKDLSTFVSPVRLCVRNIPPHLSDQQLKKIFVKHASNNARITEARVIRDMRQLDDKGKGSSKGYGFVTFTEHEAALQALRQVNNNPDIFTTATRPIVEFSIESRKALKARDLRLQRSILNNPSIPEEQKQKRLKDGLNHLESAKTLKRSNKEDEESKKSFMGTTSSVGRTSLPSHTGPKVRHDAARRKISRRDLKKQEQNAKKGKKRRVVEDNNIKEEIIPVPVTQTKKRKLSRSEKRKNKEAKDEKQFNSMVANYTSKLAAETTSNETSGLKTKVKWFD